MTAAIDWLRGEFADDREQLAAMEPADYLRAAVDTLLAPGLFVRGMVHACVYAMAHGEPGAETSVSLFKRPLRADWWRPRDDLQASLVSVWLLGWFTTPWISLPADAAAATFVALQTIPLALDPVAAIVEVAR